VAFNVTDVQRPAALKDGFVRVLGSGFAMLVLAIALTATSLGLGSFFYLTSREDSLPPAGQGIVSVVTDQPDAVVRIKNYLSLARSLGPLDRKPMALDIQIFLERKRPFRWAVLLGDDYRLPYDGPAAGSALPSGDGRSNDAVWAEGDLKRAWYVRDAGLLPPGAEPTPGMLGAVVFGETRPSSRVADLTIVGPSLRPLVHDHGYRYLIGFPVLGVPFDVEARAARATLAHEQGTIYKLAAGTYRRAEIREVILRPLEKTQWRLPRRYGLVAEAFDHDVEDRLVNATPPPESPSQWLWHGEDRLEATAVISRPAAEAERQRRQFFAGILLGLAGGFVAWVLQLAHELARKHGVSSS
jgi:hypothetical protein